MTMFLARPNSAVPAAPGAPTLIAAALGSSSIRLTVSGTADAGFKLWEFEFTATLGGVFVPLATQLSPTYDLVGLAPSTTYYFRARGTTNANQVTAYAATVSATTEPVAPPAPTGWFKNWPVMVGVYFNGFGLSDMNSSAKRAWLADADVVSWGWGNVATKADELAYFSAMKSEHPNFKLMIYINPTEAWNTGGDQTSDPVKNLIDGPNGHADWWERDTAGTKLLASFSTSLDKTRRVVQIGSLNNLGERLSQAAYRVIAASYSAAVPGNIKVHLDGFLMDVMVMPDNQYQGGNGTIDYDRNGVADDPQNPTTGLQLANGFATWVSDYFASVHIPATWEFAANWDAGPAYREKAAGGNAGLPTIAANPVTGKVPLAVYEFADAHCGVIGDVFFDNTSGNYQYQYAWSETVQRLNMQAAILPADNLTRAGRACAWLDIRSWQSWNGGSPVYSDAAKAFMRYYAALCLLHGRLAYGVKFTGIQLPMVPDELKLDFGAPVGTPSLGTLDTTTLASTPRANDYTSGSVTAVWQLYERGFVILRNDSTGVSNGTTYPGGSTATITLPTPPSGFKYQRMNAATYVNPITGKAARNIDSWNDGTDVTSVVLYPQDARIVRVVPV